MEPRGRSLAAAAAIILLVLMIIVGIGIAGLIVGVIALLVSSNVDARLAEGLGPGVAPTRAELLMVMSAAAVLLGAVIAMLYRLRRVTQTVQRGDPFNAGNPRDLRIIALLLALTEIGTTCVAFALPATWGGGHAADDIDLTSWFAVLIILVLAEVFREGARLRAEAELTV